MRCYRRWQIALFIFSILFLCMMWPVANVVVKLYLTSMRLFETTPIFCDMYMYTHTNWYSYRRNWCLWCIILVTWELQTTVKTIKQWRFHIDAMLCTVKKNIFLDYIIVTALCYSLLRTENDIVHSKMQNFVITLLE